MIKPKSGFTLIELLLAAAIFSVVMISIYSAYQAGILSYRKVDTATQGLRSCRIFFNRLQDELQNSFIYAKDDSGFKGSHDSLDFFSIPEIFEGRFSSAQVCRFQYKSTGVELERKIFRGLEGLLKQGLPYSSLKLGLEKVMFRFAVDSDNEDGFRWQESWPEKEEQSLGLPLAVKVTVTYGTEVFEKVIMLPQSLN